MTGARVAIALASVAVALGAGEFLLRALDWPHFDACAETADYAVPDPTLGFAPPPGGVVAGVRLNELGLRGPLVPRPKPAGRTRVLYVGDSTCWGLGVPFEKTFASRATALFAADAPGASFDFLIGAFPGYSSYHSAIVLEQLLSFEPDIVVFYVGARNDPTRAAYFPDADIPLRRARLDAAWHQVRILRSLEVLVDRSYHGIFRKLRSAADRARVPPLDFRANLARMFGRLQEAGIAGVAVVPPLSPEFAERLPIAETYRTLISEVAREYGIARVSLRPPLEGASGRLYFDDRYHLAEAGHEMAAQGIRQVVRAAGLLEAAERR